jgi:hypothetical protein
VRLYHVIGLQVGKKADSGAEYRKGVDDPAYLNVDSGEARSPFSAHCWLNQSPSGLLSTPVLALCDELLPESFIGKAVIHQFGEIWIVHSMSGASNLKFHQDYFEDILMPEFDYQRNALPEDRFPEKDKRRKLPEKGSLSNPLLCRSLPPIIHMRLFLDSPRAGRKFTLPDSLLPVVFTPAYT